MDEQEINKRALKAYPEIHEKEFSDERNLIPNAFQDARREGYTKAIKEINSLPKIEGWIARDYIGDYLCFFSSKPVNKYKGKWEDENAITGSIISGFGEDSITELTWEDEPIKVELLIRKV